MSEQLTIDDAIAAGQRGMAQAEDASGHWFADEADRFISRFVASAPRAFSAEELVETARTCGLIPSDDRAWGGAFQRAARAGVIRRSSEVYRRTRGHGSLAFKWEPSA